MPGLACPQIAQARIFGRGAGAVELGQLAGGLLEAGGAAQEQAALDAGGIEEHIPAAIVLADALLIQRPNMTLLVNRLIRAGYVKRRAARGDNRGVELFLRAEGERALRDVAGRLAAHERSLTVALTVAERDRLAVLLSKMVRGLREKSPSNGGERRKARAKPATPPA